MGERRGGFAAKVDAQGQVSPKPPAEGEIAFRGIACRLSLPLASDRARDKDIPAVGCAGLAGAERNNYRSPREVHALSLLGGSWR